MSLDYDTLVQLRKSHPAWRLLCSDHAPLIASFLHRAFIETNRRFCEEALLTEALEDELFQLRDREAVNPFPRAAADYLNDWSAPEHGWLRKFYRRGSDEPFFDLTPPAERAIAWLDALTERSFVGTESRLLTIFSLLRQLGEGTETDPGIRIAELQKQRDEVDAKIARITAGEMPMMDDTAIRDRFMQFNQLARDLLTDFREVESNFRRLDRRVREQIALWEGGKASLLEEIMGERDAIADSDQGRSFHAFWDFLMSSSRQEELNRLLEQILRLPAVEALEPDSRIGRVHYDWLEAGEHTQRTVADLSKQLRRFLDDQAWLENRRIMDLLRGIESKALALRERPPSGICMEIAETSVSVDLPLERPLFSPAFKPDLRDAVTAAAGEDVDPSALFELEMVDKAALEDHIRHALSQRGQISLGELIRERPLEHGLSELVVYLDLAESRDNADVDETVEETISWTGVDRTDGSRRVFRTARIPRVIFVK